MPQLGAADVAALFSGAGSSPITWAGGHASSGYLDEEQVFVPDNAGTQYQEQRTTFRLPTADVVSLPTDTVVTIDGTQQFAVRSKSLEGDGAVTVLTLSRIT